MIASEIMGYEGHRGWINHQAVNPNHRCKPYGRLTMPAAEQVLDGLGYSKINLRVRCANVAVLAFYVSLGYATDGVVNMGKGLRID